MRKVLSLKKRVGETPLEAINRFKKENPEYEDVSMTYAGRLDPMAEGVLLVLAGNEVNKKEEYLKLNKIYEFEILLGVETDTYDVLGIIKNISNKEIDVDRLDLHEFKGKQIQKYPRYSSKTINGIPLWTLARKGKLNKANIPEHEIEIFKLELIDTYKISSLDLLKNIVDKISKVKGDFRQEESVKSWTSTLTKNKEFVVLKMKAKVSSGTYIRVLAHDIGKKLDTYGLALSIKRIKVGEFS